MTAFGTHGVEMSIEAAFGYAPYAASPVWTDISKYLYSLTIRRGALPNIVPAAVAGTCTLVLNNNDSRFDPNNSASPYDPNVVVAVPIRVRAIYNAVTYPLFQGFANSWNVTYPGTGFTSRVTVPCVDGLQLLNQQSLVGSTYDEEDTDTRLGNILDDAGWPAALRSLDSNLAMVGVAVDVGGTAFTNLQATAAGEVGRIFVAADGDFTFHNRTHHAGGATSDGTFGPAAADLDYDDIRLSYDDKYLYNDVWVTRRIGADVTLRIETEPHSDAGGPAGGPVGNVTVSTPADGESVSVNWSGVLADSNVLKTALESLSSVTSVTVEANTGATNPYQPAVVIVKDATPDGILVTFGSNTSTSGTVGAAKPNLEALISNTGYPPMIWEPSLVDEVDDVEVPATFTIYEIPASIPVPQNSTSSFTGFRQRTVRLSDTAASNDAEALNVAEWLRAVFDTVRSRVAKLVVKPQSDPVNVWPVVLDVDLRDSITVKTDPKGGGDGLSQQVTVDTISHTVTLDKWQVMFGCWPLAPVEVADYWILGTSNDLDTDTVLA